MLAILCLAAHRQTLSVPRRHLHVAILAFFVAVAVLLSSRPGHALSGHRPFSLLFSQRPRLHVLLPIDAPNPLFCQSLLTVFLSGMAPVLVNFNTSAALAVKGNRFANMELKVKGVLDYLENNVTSRADVVLMADSMDVFWQLPETEIMDRYLAMDSPLVFSAEKSCFADASLCDTFLESPLPENAYGPLTDTGGVKYNRPRWLNSGLIIGRASHFLPVYAFARKVQQEKGVWNDQEAMYHAYATGEYGITVDYRSELFQSIYEAEGDITWKDARTAEGGPVGLGIESGEKKPWNLASLYPSLGSSKPRSILSVLPHSIPLPLARNLITNATPTALHFNGGVNGKDHSRPFWDEEWWVRLGSMWGRDAEEAKGAVRKVLREGKAWVAHDGREVGWGELCAGQVGQMWGMEWLAEAWEYA